MSQSANPRSPESGDVPAWIAAKLANLRRARDFYRTSEAWKDHNRDSLPMHANDHTSATALLWFADRVDALTAELSSARAEVWRLTIRDGLYAKLREKIAEYFGGDGGYAVLQDGVYALRKSESSAREQLRSVEEAEASVCPEDVGFVEYIGVLQRQLSSASERADRAEQQIKAMMDAAGVEADEDGEGYWVLGKLAAIQVETLPEAMREAVDAPSHHWFKHVHSVDEWWAARKASTPDSTPTPTPDHA